MIRLLRVAFAAVASLAVFLGVLGAAVVFGINTEAGRHLLERAAAVGGVSIEGLDGHIPDDVRARRVTVADVTGVWLEIDDLALQWQLRGLLEKQINASLLSVSRVHVSRYPKGSGATSSSSSSLDLPYRIAVETIHAGMVELPELSFSLDGGGAYGQGGLDVKAAAASADLLGQGPGKLSAHVSGPFNKASAMVTLDALGMMARGDGVVDLNALSGDLHFAVDQPAHAGVSASHLDLKLIGNADNATVHADIAGLKLPGSKPELLGADPVTLDVHYQPSATPALSAHAVTGVGELSVEGAVPSDKLALAYHLSVPRIEAFTPDAAGKADLAGRVDGAVGALDVTAHLLSDLKAGGVTSAVTGDIDAHGVPDAPTGHAVLNGAYQGEPVALEVNVALGPDHQPVVTIADARFAGIVGKGVLTAAADGGLPSGYLDVDAARLPSPATAGSAKAHVEIGRDGASPVVNFTAEMNRAAMSGLSVGKATLTGRVADPAGSTPVAAASLVADGVTSGSIREAVKLDAQGSANALALKLSATGTASIAASATLNAADSQLRLASLQATMRNQTLRLGAPTTITYAPNVTLGPTKLLFGGSSLDVAGQVSPALNLTASLRAVPAELAAVYDPALHASGSLQADARLQGTTVAPTGSVNVHGSGLRLREYPGLPAISVDATGTLQGARAQTSGNLTAGSSALQWSGSVPISAGGVYDLTTRGHANLALLDPLLARSGLQLRGMLALDGGLSGTEPRPSGTLTLQQGSLTMPSQGVRLSDIAATARGSADGVVLESLTAKAGSGSMAAHGSLGLVAPMPVDFALSANKASPVVSDLLTTVFDADLHLSGALQSAMAAGGTIKLGRTEINLPQHQPANLPNLKLRQKGNPTPPPPPPADVALDVVLSAPDQVYVRGSGLDAELGGRLHIGGTAANPKPEGGFKLRRGQYSLAGQNLNFTSGLVAFDGHLPIDPTLDFAATSSSSSVTATLAVTGTASAPSIKLSSLPELPQDEVLAQLLFHRSAADLTPLQLAQIAAGLAQLADVGGSGGIDPLGAARKRLGLDVLTVNSAPGAAPSVEAGRTIAKGVYVGAKQSTGGSGSQATLRLDLARGLRLEADLGVAPAAAASPVPGAPPTGNQVGIVYEFEY